MLKFLVLFIFILNGCMPQAAKKSTSAQNSSEDEDEIELSDRYTQSDTNLAWYYLSATSNSLTFSRTNTNVAYLKGTLLEDYLLSFADAETHTFTDKTFCIEMNFGTHGIFRTRAIPITVNNYASGKKTIYVKVDIGNATANSATCGPSKTVSYFTNSNWGTPITPTPVYNSLSSICPTCLTNIEVGTIKLLEVMSTTSLKQVNPALVNLSLITFFVQAPTSNSGTSLCSQSGCQASGYDCCLEGQCVNDASLRSNLQSSSDLTEAVAAVAENPLSFLSYPQYYYICPQITPTEPENSGGEPVDPVAEAEARFEALKKDYYCVDELKTNSLSTPYQLDPYNSAHTYTKCSTSTSNELYWEDVLIRMYDNCGCENQPLLDDKLLYCPKYYYRVVSQNQAGVPTSIECAAYDENEIPLPFQNLNVQISSKTAPHRFFNTTGVEINPYKTITVTDTAQETQGYLTQFLYTDDVNMIPQNGSYNMNSLLGPITVDLDLARPAKVIDVDIDQNYLIATTTGNYTPCSTCASDSWYSSFTATPSTPMGVGLRAVGHSTTRDAFGFNNTLGNWEDTIYGRACWVPPTMIPYGHKTYTDAQTQRINRLTTQAAMYINGYQRDWYGFNRGAMIGSWDGVNWFAIGKGRIVKSKTKKLFLAINAPFADLAEEQYHTVSVQHYDQVSTAANKDFDPTLSTEHLLQNEAGTCQAYHQCATDTDCITKLGWEYVCANTNDMKVKSPTFDAETAAEKVTAPLAGGVMTILSQTSLGGSSTKRCVYRGAGAICATNAYLPTVLGPTSNKTKLLTCAPNFYCAGLNSANFNREVARFAGPMDQVIFSPMHFFGRDTNQLGRPLHYVTANNTLPSTVVTAITENVQAHYPNTTLTPGICRPGKQIPTLSTAPTAGNEYTHITNPFVQQMAEDSVTISGTAYTRADFINQIGSCDSSITNTTPGLNRVMSCPVIDATTGNYFQFTSSYFQILFPTRFDYTTYQTQSLLQNGCGREILKYSSTLPAPANYSPFNSIEAAPLPTQVALATFSRDACLRKPGSVCHSDLDCSPNKFHADKTALFNNEYFGSAVNKKYYEEYLVCGQADPKPFLTEASFATYDMTKNRCCREVGKDITTYTPEAADNVAGTNISNTDLIYINPTLKSEVKPMATNNIIADLNATGQKYERYSVSTLISGNTNTVISANARRDNTGALDTTGTTFDAANIMTTNQWKVIGDVNSKTCCGGGWIRKFSDGTTNWRRTDRLQLNVTNFQCLNYQLPHMNTIPSDFPTLLLSIYAQFNSEYNRYCTSTANNGGSCVQTSFTDTSVYTVGNTCSGIAIGSSNIQDCSDSSNILCNPNIGSISYYGPPSFGSSDDVAAVSGTVQVVSTLPVAQGHNVYGWSNLSNPLSLFPPVSADSSPRTYVDLAVTDDQLPEYRRNVTIKVPSYIPITGDFKVFVQSSIQNSPQKPIPCGTFPTMADGYSTDATVQVLAHVPATALQFMAGASGSYNTNYPTQDTTIDAWSWGHVGCMYVLDSDRVLRVYISPNRLTGSDFNGNNAKWGVALSFIPAGSAAHQNTYANTPQAKPACTNTYYLEKLSKLELSGIPQISFEKLVCNNNVDRLVPGIFKDDRIAPSQTEGTDSAGNQSTDLPPTNTPANVFDDPSFAFLDSNGQWRTTHHGLEHDAIFSEHEFKCCTPLGKETKNTATCCSSFGVLNESTGKYTCKLPEGTDLSVYFNRFVSNEGTDPLEPGGGLNVTNDFEALTGEPKFTTAVNSKLMALGQTYCENGVVRKGGAFGKFVSEPANTNNDRIYGIVDSSSDIGTSSGNGSTVTVGYQAFADGYRWNHHLYCQKAN